MATVFRKVSDLSARMPMRGVTEYYFARLRRPGGEMITGGLSFLVE